jgi:hypothetical protein
MSKRRLAAAGLAPALLIASAAAAQDNQYRITPYEKAVCLTDAVRFCRGAYPDQDRLIACMKDNRSNLSSICQSALIDGLKRRHIPL